MQSISLLLIFGVVCASAHNIRVEVLPRIVGGKDVAPGQFPYQVSLRYRLTNQHSCGASLINRRFILTAAHCTIDTSPFDMYAMVGSIDRSEEGFAYDLEAITPHPDSVNDLFIHDLSLIKTIENIIFNDFRPTDTITDAKYRQRCNCGDKWMGTTHPGDGMPRMLKYENLQTIDLDTCRELYESKNFTRFISESVICTSGSRHIGSCMGDSGGPLVDISNPSEQVLAGVVSWGIACAQGYPDVFARVYSHLEWLTREMKKQVSEIEWIELNH